MLKDRLLVVVLELLVDEDILGAVELDVLLLVEPDEKDILGAAGTIEEVDILEAVDNDTHKVDMDIPLVVELVEADILGAVDNILLRLLVELVEADILLLEELDILLLVVEHVVDEEDILGAYMG